MLANALQRTEEHSISTKRINTSTMSSQRRCDLLDLPAEVRLQIYEHVFCAGFECLIGITSAHELHVSLTRKEPYYGLKARKLMRLLLVCRTITQEASPPLYSLTIFHMRITARNYIPLSCKVISMQDTCRFPTARMAVNALHIHTGPGSTNELHGIVTPHTAWLPTDG
jgi:hypothetical protein